MSKVFTKEGLIQDLTAIGNRGWIENNATQKNDGTVGHIVETILGIEENNLPLPNASEWELKARRIEGSSPVTLFHKSPSPTAFKIVSTVLVPKYGWPHAQAGSGKHPADAKSFRQTLTLNQYTDRGFTVVIEKNDGEDRLRLKFDASKVAPHHSDWLQSVKDRVGHLDDLDNPPYWGMSDLHGVLASKLSNAFLMSARVKQKNNKEHFWYVKGEIVTGINFAAFTEALKNGNVKVDFDARTGKDHGTKFRVVEKSLSGLYATHRVFFDKTEEADPDDVEAGLVGENIGWNGKKLVQENIETASVLAVSVSHTTMLEEVEITMRQKADAYGIPIEEFMALVLENFRKN